MRLSFFISFFSYLIVCNAGAQQIPPEVKHYQDSLWKCFNNHKLSDSTRLKAIDNLAWDLQFMIPDSGIAMAKLQLAFAVKAKKLKFQSLAYTTMGASAYSLGRWDDALKYHMKSREINIKRKDNRAIGANENNISLVYFAKGDYLTAIDHVYKSMRLYESVNNEDGKANANNNLGMVFSAMGKPEKALEFYKKTIAYRLNKKQWRGLALNYNNIGIVYFQLGRYNEAMESYKESLRLSIENYEPQTQVIALNELGGLYFQLGNFSSAQEYLKKCIDLSMQMQDVETASQAYNNLGKVYLELKKNKEAAEACAKGYNIARELGIMEATTNNCECLYQAYKSMGDKSKALEYFEKTFKLRDSMLNINNRKEIARKELQYDYEKRTQANKLQHEKEQSVRETTIRLQNESLEHERLLKYFLYSGILIIIIILLILFRRYRISSQQKRIIEEQKHIVEEQKHEVEEKNKDITDSINYAQRIQRSFLPKTDDLNDMLGEYFVLFQPKDIVSGDFYWGASVVTTSKTEASNRVIVFATGDCTGHGVPGAMMTMIGNTLLNQTLKNPDVNTPADALHFVNTELPKNLKRQKGEVSIRDGMDLVMIAIDRGNKKLYMAGANNALYLLRDKKLTEYKGDSQAVSASDDSVKEKFTDHRIDIFPGDIIYMTTDGFPDQFGGPKGKKFKYKQLEEILISICDLPMPQQKEILLQRFTEWKGNLEQVDDVTIVGIKI